MLERRRVHREAFFWRPQLWDRTPVVILTLGIWGGNVLSPHSTSYLGTVKRISVDGPLRDDFKAFCKREMPPALDDIERNDLITKEEKQAQRCHIPCRELAAGKNRVQVKPLVLRASAGIRPPCCLGSSGRAWREAVHGAWAGGSNDSSAGLLSKNHYLW